MNTQLKQRIIGSIIVVAFLAIAIPFLLSGSKTKPVAANTSNNSEAAIASAPSGTNANADVVKLPLPAEANTNSQQATTSEPGTPSAVPTNDTATISQGNVPLTLASAATTPTTTAEPGAAVTTSNATPATPTTTTNPPATNTPAEAMKVPAATSIASESKTAAQNPALQASLAQKETDVINNHGSNKPHAITHTRTTHKVIAKNKTSKHTITTSIKTKAAKTTIKSQHPKNLAISAGVYHDEAKAQNVLKKLHADNYRNAAIQKITIKNKTRYRVIAGNATTQEKAEALAKRVEKNLKIKAAIIPMANAHLNVKNTTKAVSTKHQHKK